MMKCEQIQPLMLPYLDEEAASSEKVVIQAHLASCWGCRQELESLDILIHRLQEHLSKQAESISPPVQIQERILTKLSIRAPREAPRNPGFKVFHKASFAESATAMKTLGLIILILFALTVSLMAFVPSVQAQVTGVIQKIVLSTYTWAVRVESQDQGKVRPLPSDMWIIHTDIGNYAGNAPRGVEPTILYVDNLPEAQALVDFQIKTPAELPQGYQLGEVKLAPIGGSYWIFLIYKGPGEDIYIVQMPTGPQTSNKQHEVDNLAVGILTDGTIEEITFEGQPAAWIEEHSLSWVADSINYNVGGLDLTLDRAMRIARSLR